MFGKNLSPKFVGSRHDGGFGRKVLTCEGEEKDMRREKLACLLKVL